MLDGGAGLAQRGVKRDLADVEIGAGESLVRDGDDALDADVARASARSSASARRRGDTPVMR